MPFHYEIETDALYLEGIEKANYETVARMLRLGQFTKEVIVLVVGVDMAFVLKVERDVLSGGK